MADKEVKYSNLSTEKIVLSYTNHKTYNLFKVTVNSEDRTLVTEEYGEDPVVAKLETHKNPAEFFYCSMYYYLCECTTYSIRQAHRALKNYRQYYSGGDLVPEAFNKSELVSIILHLGKSIQFEDKSGTVYRVDYTEEELIFNQTFRLYKESSKEYSEFSLADMVRALWNEEYFVNMSKVI